MLKNNEAIAHTVQKVMAEGETPAAHEFLIESAEDARAKRAKDLARIFREAHERAVTEQRSYLALAGALDEAGRTAVVRARETRMALSGEISQIVRSLRDLREILGDQHHEQEVARLAEFVSIAERLKALKDSGFLDALVETLIRLEGDRR